MSTWTLQGLGKAKGRTDTLILDAETKAPHLVSSFFVYANRADPDTAIHEVFVYGVHLHVRCTDGRSFGVSLAPHEHQNNWTTAGPIRIEQGARVRLEVRLPPGYGALRAVSVAVLELRDGRIEPVKDEER